MKSVVDQTVFRRTENYQLCDFKEITQYNLIFVLIESLWRESKMAASNEKSEETNASPVPLTREADSLGQEGTSASSSLLSRGFPVREQEELIPDGLSFAPKNGFMTRSMRKQFLEREIRAGRMTEDCLTDCKIISLNASLDRNDPLFFWQIYGLAGREPIKNLLQRFYQRVFDDSESWFRGVFERLSSQQYHVTAQMIMYTDCFGGGRLYYGSEDRLDIHHGQTMARDILTTPGATRWTGHMVKTLEEDTELNAIDPRIRIAINTFLQFFMEKYASLYDFDASGIHFGDYYPPHQK